MDVLEGFKPVDFKQYASYRNPSRCSSRALLEAFLDSGEDCLAKPMPTDELKRVAYNLRHYRSRHDEFENVGIGGRNGMLILYRRNV